MALVQLLSITPNAEELIEVAGRTCYLSHEKMDSDSKERFIVSLIRSGHTSILEHAYATFRIYNASRAMTHQLVRHRLASFSQQSQRYVSESDFGYVTPSSIRSNPDALRLYNEYMENSKRTYTQLRDLKINKEDARFVLPNAVTSEIVISANFREFRHIFILRCSPKAQWEIRYSCLDMLKMLKEHAPLVFKDFFIDEERKVATTEYDE